MLYALSLLIGLASAAEPCDAKALTAAVTNASPVAMSTAFSKLYACSAPDALKIAPTVLQRMVVGDGTPEALLAAVKLKSYDGVRTWLTTQEPDIRSRMVARLGEACAQHPEVGDFFLDAAAKDTAHFWAERWHKGLANCRTPAVQKLLGDALTGPDVGKDSRNKAGFQSVLEVYARNLRSDAVPTLATLLAGAKDEDTATTLIVVFADAANVGGQEGTDAAAAKAAVQAILAAAPGLPARAIERARGTLTALGDEAAADSIGRYRYADRFVDGQYLWGVAAVEDYSCKNAEKRATLHVGTFQDKAGLWADKVQAAAEAAARSVYKLQGAEKCKGTGTVQIEVSPEPLAAADVAAWVDARKEAFTAASSGKKATVVDEVAVTR